MKCPFTFHERTDEPYGTGVGLECLRSGCQWNDVETGECAVFALAKHFQLIADQYSTGRPWRPVPGHKATTRRT